MVCPLHYRSKSHITIYTGILHMHYILRISHGKPPIQVSIRSKPMRGPRVNFHYCACHSDNTVRCHLWENIHFQGSTKHFALQLLLVCLAWMEPILNVPSVLPDTKLRKGYIATGKHNYIPSISCSGTSLGQTFSKWYFRAEIRVTQYPFTHIIIIRSTIREPQPQQRPQDQWQHPRCWQQ